MHTIFNPTNAHNIVFFGLKCNKLIILYGMEDVKFVNAQQAKQVYHFKNIKERLYKTNVPVW